MTEQRQKFTPGPWKVDEQRAIVATWDNGEEVTVCAMNHTHWCGSPDSSRNNERITAESPANAHLIAAAPEMYAALHDALALFEKNHALSRFNWGASGLRAEDIRELNETPLKIRAALLAAEGGQP